MKTHLININGVLRKTVGGAIISEGIELYKGLASTGQIVLVRHHEDIEESDAWLELNGLVRHAWVSERGALAAGDIRRDGYDVGMIVVADPEEALFHIMSGHNTLLFTHARYAQPRWRPDTAKGVRAWSSIIDETARLAKLKAQDARLRDES